MTLTFIGLNTVPTYMALSSDIEDNGTIDGAVLVGRTVYLTDLSDNQWRIILPDLKLSEFNPLGNGTGGTVPTYVSSEIGNVDTETIVLTLSQNVSASDYALGWTLKRNGIAEDIISATRQSTHSVIYFEIETTLDTDVLTLEYNSNIGGISGEVGGVYMNNISTQTVTNNV